MLQFMTKYSKPSKITLSPETEEQIAKVMANVAKFQVEVDKILIKYQVPVFVDNPSQVIERLFGRFHSVAIELNRRHNERSSLTIKDEYDVQDLLRGMLKIYFDNIKDEEYTPSYGGSSTRMDILLKNEQIVIETKMMRASLTQKKVCDELIIDKAHYRVHPDCKKFYALVYDPLAMLKNPRGFEQDLSDKLGGIETKVFVIPRTH